MKMISEKISSIDLPAILESEGIELIRSGNGFQFMCCFYDDRHPSGSLFNKGGKWRWHCFGCQAGGDAVDFVMRRHNIDFKAALSYLSIESGPLPREQRVRIKKSKARRKVTDAFKVWELAAIDELRDTISTAYRISSKWKTIEDFDHGAMWLDPIADLQGQLNVLMMNPKKDQVGIYRRWKDRGNRF